MFYDYIYGPDAHDPLFALTMTVTFIHSYFMHCRALYLQFSLFIYSHCSFFLQWGIVNLLHQQSPYVQDLVSSRDVQTSFKKALFSGAATLGNGTVA